MELKREYIVLSIIIVVLLGVFVWVSFTKSAGVIRYKLPTVAGLDKESIDKMVFESRERSITMMKTEDGGWVIMPDRFPADPSKTGSMLSAIAGLRITELISKQQAYDRYDLDNDGRMELTAYSGENVVRNFYIGKTSSTSSHTYVTLSGDPNIYGAQGDLRTLFDKEVDELRDKEIMSFNRQEISEIVLETKGETVIITKEMRTPQGAEEGAAPEEVWMANVSTVPVPENTINDILGTMSGLVCEEFIKDAAKAEYEEKTPMYRITARGNKDYVLTIFDHPGDNKYPAYSSVSDYPFLLIGWKTTRMMKDLDEIATEGE